MMDAATWREGGLRSGSIGELVAVLKHLRAERAAGRGGSFTRDPAWLVNQAINRRAGWIEDTHFRGSCRPVAGRYPAKAEGGYLGLLRRLAGTINRPRLIVRLSELGECRELLMARIPERITTPADEEGW